MTTQAATCHNIESQAISIKGATQTLDAFQPVIAREYNSSQLEKFYGHLLKRYTKF